MESGSFHMDGLTALVLAGILVGLWWVMRWWDSRCRDPRWFYSDLSTLHGVPQGWRCRWALLPQRLQLMAILLALLAIMDPHLRLPQGQDTEKDLAGEMGETEEKVEEIRTPTEGIGIYLVLDRSGSMREPVSAGRRGKQTRMDVLKEVTAQFIKGSPRAGLGGRPNDLIGLVAFARVGQVLAPLTLDHQYILKALSELDSVDRREEDGTAIGYAIYKTAHLIEATTHFAAELKDEGKPAYEIKSNIIILVTDGFHYPSPLDKEHPLRGMDVLQAAEYAASQGIRLYIVNIEPALARSRFATEMGRLRQAALLTGGELLIAGQQGSLSEIYAYIDELETSTLPIERRQMAEVSETVRRQSESLPYRKLSFFPFLLSLALLCSVVGWTLDLSVLRRLP